MIVSTTAAPPTFSTKAIGASALRRARRACANLAFHNIVLAVGILAMPATISASALRRGPTSRLSRLECVMIAHRPYGFVDRRLRESAVGHERRPVGCCLRGTLTSRRFHDGTSLRRRKATACVAHCLTDGPTRVQT